MPEPLLIDYARARKGAHPNRPIDLQRGMLRKLETNRGRGYMHGGKAA